MTGSPHPSTDDVLRRCVTGDGDARVVTLDPRFQGLPGTAHGGTVLALFDALAPEARSRTVAGVYHRRVPLGAPLRLAIDAAAGSFQLSDGTALLVSATVSMSAKDEAGVAPPTAGADPMILPLSTTCFACGTENALGLRARLTIDDDSVRGEWTPRDEMRGRDGALAPVALTALLDEAAFWLGAAASGEAGVTTDLRVRLHRPVAFGRRIVVAGARASVRPRADDPRHWQTEVAAWDDTGVLVASAGITFVAVRGAARKLVAGLLAMNPADVLRRVFPGYVG